MNHYVCSGGCLTVQLEKGMCPVNTCVRYRNPLSLCDCPDGTHGDWLFRNHPDPEKAKKAAKAKLAKLPEEFDKLTQITQEKRDYNRKKQVSTPV